MVKTIGLLHTGIREDEKMIQRAAQNFSNIKLEMIDLRKQILSMENKSQFNDIDLILVRCAAQSKADQALCYFTEIGKNAINNLTLSRLCQNKFAANLRLSQCNIPTPKFALAYNEEEVKNAIAQMGGYPVVIKPAGGTSWGRLMGKINDDDALEAILEHKQALGVNHQSFYIQEYIKKPERDIRVYLIGDRVIAAVYRKSQHWITNTARGASIVNCPVTKEIEKICFDIKRAIGSGLFAIDLFETKSGLMVNEINHTMEFKNVVKKTNADIAEEIINYCIKNI